MRNGGPDCIRSASPRAVSANKADKGRFAKECCGITGTITFAPHQFARPPSGSKARPTLANVGCCCGPFSVLWASHPALWSSQPVFVGSQFPPLFPLIAGDHRLGRRTRVRREPRGSRNGLFEKACQGTTLEETSSVPFRAGKKMSAPISYPTEKKYRASSFTYKSIAFSVRRDTSELQDWSRPRKTIPMLHGPADHALSRRR